jgi:two-component system, chemotaxis family, CheB/CheR fusion protein
VLVDARFDIVHLDARANPFLSLSGGPAHLNLLKVARPELVPGLRDALRRARREMQPVRREAIELHGVRGSARIDLEVVPIASRPAARAGPAAGRAAKAPTFMVLFASAAGDHARPEPVAASGTIGGDPLASRNLELEQANRELLDVVAGIDIPIVLLGPDGRIRQITPAARALLHLAPGDVGRRIDELGLGAESGDLAPLVSEVLDDLAARERDVQGQGGRWYRMQVRPYWTIDNELDGVVLSFVDVDEHRRAMAEARAATGRAAAMLDAIRVPLMVLDDSVHVRSVNRAFHTVFGGQAEVVGASWFQIDGRAWDRPELRAALDDLLADDRDVNLELRVEVPRGHRRAVAVAGSAVRWSSDPPLILLTLIDITHRAQRLDAAEAARAVAEAANRTKDVFLATLSHELRVPLHTITLQADLLLAGAATGPARLRRVGEAVSQAARAQEQIISDLLDVSAILAGKMVLKRQAADPLAVVRAAAHGVRAAAAAKEIRLRIALARSVGMVMGDPTRLQQVVANLLSNAIKFTPAGGQILVKLEGTDGGGVRIRVSDNGQGIAPEVLPHVFDRFVQGEEPGSASYGGLGLGLAIVRDLVRLQGGTVTADSPGVGGGATFTVELPGLDERAAAARRATGASAPRPRSELKGIRVLVVEDDPSSRDVLSDILRFRSAEVMAVGSAAEVVNALSDFRPHVMLCDVAMPGEDGYSLMRRVRALAPRKGGRVPAVALTALATKKDRRRALSAGFHMHVPKPTPAAELCQAVLQVYRAARGKHGRTDAHERM